MSDVFYFWIMMLVTDKSFFQKSFDPSLICYLTFRSTQWQSHAKSYSIHCCHVDYIFEGDQANTSDNDMSDG